MASNVNLVEPKVGEPIRASFGQNVVKSITSLNPIGGYGISILQNANGVTYSLKETRRRSKDVMPFDITLESYNPVNDGSELATFKVATCNESPIVEVVINGEASFIPIKSTLIDDNYNVTIPDVELPEGDDERLFIVVKFSYEGQAMVGGYTFPTEYEFDVVEEDYLESNIFDPDYGIKLFPIGMITKLSNTEGADANYGANSHVWSIGTDNSDAVDYFVLTQLHRGNIFINLFTAGTRVMEWIGGGDPIGRVVEIIGGGTTLTRVMEITGAVNSIYTGTIITDGENPQTGYTMSANMTDLALTSTLPVGTRILVHGVATKYLGGS